MFIKFSTVKEMQNVIHSLRFPFGMHLNFEETQLLLRIAKFAILDSRDRRDGIIIYALMHGLSIFECDDLLNNDNLITLV